MGIKKSVLFVLVLLTLIMPVKALDLNTGYISQGFEMLHQLLSNSYVQWGLLMIIVAVIIHAVLHSTLSKVPHLQGAASNRIAWMLSLLTILSIIYFNRGQSVDDAVGGMLGKYSTMIGIVLGVIVFFSIRRRFGGGGNA